MKSRPLRVVSAVLFGTSAATMIILSTFPPEPRSWLAGAKMVAVVVLLIYLLYFVFLAFTRTGEEPR